MVIINATQCLNCLGKTGGVSTPFRRLLHDRGGSTPPTPSAIRPPRGVENRDDWGDSKINWGGSTPPTPPAIQALEGTWMAWASGRSGIWLWIGKEGGSLLRAFAAQA